jgi:hypothetical protein
MGTWFINPDTFTYSPTYAPVAEASWNRMPKGIGSAGQDPSAGGYGGSAPTRRVYTDDELAKIYSWILDGARNN